MKLQNRDQEILKTIYEQQFLFFDHLKDYFFPGCTDGRVSHRMRALIDAGLVQKQRLVFAGNRSTFRLTRSGINYVETTNLLRVPHKQKLTQATIIHDALVTSVRLRLTQFWNGTWIPERAIKSAEYPEVPDGVLLFPSGKKIVIEVENSLKGPSRYGDLFKRWEGTQVALLLYIASTPALMRMLQGHLHSAPTSLPLGLLSWEEFKSGIPKVWTRAGEMDLLSRRAF